MASAGNLQYFWLRRLHSLLGIVPIGAFVLEHFFSNSYAFQGAGAYNEMVQNLQTIPMVLLIEVGFIGLPIFFHIVLGLVIMVTGSSNVTSYGHYRNWMYFFQRVSGFLGVIYIGYHVWTTRIWAAMNDTVFTFADMQQLLTQTWEKWFYIIGIISISFHFANGLATSAITWGITVSPRSQKIATLASWVMFLGMSAWGLLILREFV